eukprot:TRINITY_DN7668_c0_g1_i1.p1 TRINITY_DN7668_c0_g1~~TRINITY_DN7668_c0_g1_i1.p1  ORF type:complete len:173 (-),score=23.05 TRINITY_DN7668_c0_g1_i1:111-629(-)
MISAEKPKFFTTIQQEFQTLKKDYLKQSSSQIESPLCPNITKAQVKDAGRNQFYHINKAYLKDFWRHEEEKKHGEYITMMLCESVGRDKAHSYSSIFCWGEENRIQTSSGKSYTRWQEVATHFFAFLLGMSEFDPLNHTSHLSALVRLKEKASRQDADLESIIKFFISTLEL